MLLRTGWAATWGALVGCTLAACAPAASRARPGAASEELLRTAGSYETQFSLSRRDAVYVDTLRFDAARAWAALPAAYGALGLPVSAADPAAMRLGVSVHPVRRIDGRLPSAFLECGRGPMGGAYADRYQVHLTVETRVVPGAGGSRVESTVRATARARETSGNPIPCDSRGTLERRIVELVSERAGSGSDG